MFYTLFPNNPRKPIRLETYDDQGRFIVQHARAAERILKDVKRRRVGYTLVGKLRVSTIFLSFDHNFIPGGPPVLWETMIFKNGMGDVYTERYTNYDAALAGHKRAVAWAKQEGGQDFVASIGKMKRRFVFKGRWKVYPV